MTLMNILHPIILLFHLFMKNIYQKLFRGVDLLHEGKIQVHKIRSDNHDKTGCSVPGERKWHRCLL